MSIRLEWIEATDPYVKPAVFLKGETLADGNRITSEMALGFGPLIIEGTADQLRSLLAHAGDAIDSDARDDDPDLIREEFEDREEELRGLH